MPVFAGDDRVRRVFTLVPGSEFGVDALAAIERTGASSIPWPEACERSFDLILAVSPKGELSRLRGPCLLLPHGAGFSKTIPGEGSGPVPSGLDPAYLLPDGHPLAAVHALAHPGQLRRLAALSPEAAGRAVVTGDPVLDRILASRSHRDRYREVLGTGGRRLIVLTSTWGRESLVERRPGLFTDLATQLPHDAYQLAAVVHPNERAEIGDLNLSELLAPAVKAGLIQAEPYEEWAALLIAADAVITDHGSAALYAAALDRPLIGACDGGAELLPGSPMAALLAAVPHLEQPGDLEAAIAAHRPGSGPVLAEPAFAEQGHALGRLRAEAYRLLGLAPLSFPADARPLPPPVTAAFPVSAFAVNAFVEGTEVHVERFPAHTEVSAHHLAAEYGAATDRFVGSAGLIYRQAGQAPTAARGETWTDEWWTAWALDEFPGCRTAAVIVNEGRCVVRTRPGSFLAVEIEPFESGGRLVRTDPAAVLSAVHAWLAAGPGLPTVITCVTGPHRFRVRLLPATDKTRAL